MNFGGGGLGRAIILIAKRSFDNRDTWFRFWFWFLGLRSERSSRICRSSSCRSAPDPNNARLDLCVRVCVYMNMYICT